MSIRLIAGILARLLLLLAGFLAVAAGVAALYGETDELIAFAMTIGIVVAVSIVTLALTARNSRDALMLRDGFLFVTLSWIVASAVGALPFTLSGAIPSYTDAFFESMSGFTTTGASILTAIEPLPQSILFWRSLTHWLGGMGIVVLTIAILPRLGIGALQLMRSEAPGPTVDKLTPRVAGTAKILWRVYVGLTVIQTVLLMFGGMSLFDATTHTFGTLATGGFSPRDASVGADSSPYLHVVITVFMILAGINFTLHFKLLRGDVRSFFGNVETRAYLLIFVIATAMISYALIAETRYPTTGESVRYAAFQAASILTTTGYATADFDAWPYVAKIVLFGLMFVGGCAGSTGGGVKVIRVLTLFKLGLNELKYLVHPRGIFPTKIGERTVKKDILFTISAFFFFYVAILLVTAFVVATAGHDVLTSFSTALATVGNIGPGFEAVGPTGNYAFFPGYVKWFLSVAMLTGRLEVYSVIILLTPTLWRK